jgi:type IV pilus assembly protein PilN
VAFAITGPFATLSPTQQLTLMRQLGSEGMARRLQLLESEGLIP